MAGDGRVIQRHLYYAAIDVGVYMTLGALVADCLPQAGDIFGLGKPPRQHGPRSWPDLYPRAALFSLPGNHVQHGDVLSCARYACAAELVLRDPAGQAIDGAKEGPPPRPPSWSLRHWGERAPPGCRRRKPVSRKIMSSLSRSMEAAYAVAGARRQAAFQ